MDQQDGENPYVVGSGPDGEETAAKSKTSVLRIIGVSTFTLMVAVFLLSFFSDLEIERFKSIELGRVFVNTGIGVIIASIILPVLWGVVGLIFRRKDLPALTRSEASFFLLKCIGSSVLVFATIPSVIEGFGNTYPVSEYTVSYFLILAYGMICLFVSNVRRFRREPDLKSAFVCCLPGLLVIMAIGMVGLFMYAVAQSAYT